MKTNFIIFLLIIVFCISCVNKTIEENIPILTLRGDIAMQIPLNEEFVEPGYVAFDEVDGDLTSRVLVDSISLDTSKEGVYQIYYSVTNRYGLKSATAMRTINVVDGGGDLLLKGESFSSVELGSVSIFDDPGFLATDVDGVIKNDRVEISSSIDFSSPGTYYIVYTFTDSYDIVHSAVRTVQIVLPSTPVIVLQGNGGSPSAPFIVQAGMTPDEIKSIAPGYMALSKVDGDISQKVVVDYTTIDTSVNPAVVQSLEYSITDSSTGDKISSIVRYVRVLADGIAPEVFILKAVQQTIEVASSFEVNLATDIIAEDNNVILPVSKLRYVIDQLSSLAVDATVIRSDVPVENVTEDAGFFRITYYAVDDSGNEGSAIRLIEVVDYEKPELVFNGEILTRSIEIAENFDYGASISSLIPDPTASDNAKSYALHFQGDLLTSIDSRKVGKYNQTAYATDATGNESFKVRRIINVLPPPVPAVANGSFEDYIPAVGKIDEENNLTGWQWVDMRGYLVQGTYQSWGHQVTSIEPVIYIEPAQYASKSVAGISDFYSRTGTVAAFTTGSVLTKEQENIPNTLIPINFAAYITRSMGSLVQKDIFLFKDVDYVAEMYSRMAISASSQSLYFRIIAQTPGMLLNGKTELQYTGDAASLTQSYWGRFEIPFSANIDGQVTIEIEKSDISGGDRAGTEILYDDVAILVEENGYQMK